MNLVLISSTKKGTPAFQTTFLLQLIPSQIVLIPAETEFSSNLAKKHSLCDWLVTERCQRRHAQAVRVFWTVRKGPKRNNKQGEGFSERELGTVPFSIYLVLN